MEKKKKIEKGRKEGKRDEMRNKKEEAMVSR